MSVQNNWGRAVVGLHRDLNFLAGLRCGLSVRDSHFNLPQQRYDLFRLVRLVVWHFQPSSS
jgi:hypothetical protein